MLTRKMGTNFMEFLGRQVPQSFWISSCHYFLRTGSASQSIDDKMCNIFPRVVLALTGHVTVKAYLSYFTVLVKFSWSFYNPYFSLILFYSLSIFTVAVESLIVISLIGFICWLAFVTSALTSVILPLHQYQNQFSYLQKW